MDPAPILDDPKEDMTEPDMTGIQDKPDPEYLDPRSYQELIASDTFHDIRDNLYSEEKTLVLQAVQNLRRMLTLPTKFADKVIPIKFADKVIQAGLVPLLVEMLRDDLYPDIQLEAAWALTNIASGNSKQTKAVVDEKASPQLIRLLSSSTKEDIRGKCACALGNIAGDSVAHRDMLLKMGALPALLTVFESENSHINTTRQSTRALSNLLRGKPAPSLNNIALALPHIAKILIHSSDIAIVADACRALSDISDAPNDRIQMVLDQNVVPKLVKMLNSGDPKLQAPALRTVGNIVTGNDRQTDQVIRSGVLSAILPLLNHEKKMIRKEACWTLSNIAAGTKDQIEAFIQCDGMILQLIGVLKTSDLQSKKEALWAFANATSGGTDEQVLQIAMAGAIPPMCSMLSSSESRVTQVALEGLHNIIKAADKEVEKASHEDTLYQIVEIFHACGGITAIEDLKEHASEDVVSRAAVFFTSENKKFCHILLTFDAMQYTETEYE